jgi:hypothetical protein
MMLTQDGTYVAVLGTGMVRIADGYATFYSLDHTHDLAIMRDSGRRLWVAKKGEGTEEE